MTDSHATSLIHTTAAEDRQSISATINTLDATGASVACLLFLWTYNYVDPAIDPSVRPSVRPSAVRPSIHPSIHPPTHPSIHHAVACIKLQTCSCHSSVQYFRVASVAKISAATQGMVRRLNSVIKEGQITGQGDYIMEIVSSGDARSMLMPGHARPLVASARTVKLS